MAVGVRTQDLHKVYSSSPPLAAGGGITVRGEAKGSKQPKAQIPALDGLSLEVQSGRDFRPAGPERRGQIDDRRSSDDAGAADSRTGVDWRPRCVEGTGDGEAADRCGGATSESGFLAHRARNSSFSRSIFRHWIRRSERSVPRMLLESFKLTERANQMVRGFSGGMMQRLSIARAMMHDPQVLISRRTQRRARSADPLLLWEIIREYNRHGQDHPADDAQHGRGGRAVPATGDRRSRTRLLPRGRPRS